MKQRYSIDAEKRQQIIKAALRSAVAGLSKEDISEEKVRAILDLTPEDNVLSIRNTEAVVKIDSMLGSAIFIKESGPSWVEYKDHRSIDEWKWLLDTVETIEDTGLIQE